ncbi:MAG: hypothetical protein JOZ05_22325 [Acetobacteraceae bacterium]|nr:hypothetical protein [Acetobacteraceae bacterium]
MKEEVVFILLLALAACVTGDSPQAQCERQADQDPTVRSIYRGDQGDYTQLGPARSNLLWAKRQATIKCLQAKGVLPPGGVEPVRPPVY